MVAKSTHIGVGLYSIADAARLSGVHPTKINHWTDAEDGIVRRVLDPREDLLTFREVMEVQFIKMFRDEGLSLQAIRKVADAASRRFRTNYPFSVKRFDTDGKTVFATLVNHNTNASIIEDLRKGQYVFEPIIRPFFRKLEYRRMREVTRYWPQDKSGRVVLDPARKFGQPIDAETGVPTRTIFDATRAGGGQDWRTVADWLGIPVSAVEAAVEFEQSLSA